MKFLIDECLSPELVAIARAHGHGEFTHITWLGMRSRKDWSIVRRAVTDGYVLATIRRTSERCWGARKCTPALSASTWQPA